MCVMALGVSAQTYNNGVWYALYDTDSHGMSTISSYPLDNIFAPTTGQLSFKWTYTKVELTGWFATNATHIYQSSDGGSSSSEIGTLTDKTWNTEHTTTLQIDANINWLQWDRPVGNTHKVTIYDLAIPLAKHILLPSGTYGTTTGSLTFEARDMLTVSEPQRVNLRSFLSNGDITVTSSMPDIFRIGSPDNTAGLTYEVGANACASANGKAAQAGGGSLGNIASYAFDVYFTPQEVRDYSADIVLTDGTSTATIHVSGTGLLPEQPIDTIPVDTIPSDTIPVDTIPTPPTPVDSYYAYSAHICEGDVYSDALFEGLTASGIYTDTIPNKSGADSIITLTLSVNPYYFFEDNRSILQGEQDTWQSIDLSLIPVGDTMLIASYASLYGCDSTFVLYLNVRPRITTYGRDTIELCSGEKAVYENKTYRRNTTDSILLSVPNSVGGDSIVELVVIVYPVVRVETQMTITEGEPKTWQEYDLSIMPVGDTTLVAEYTSIHGCDSTYVLLLTVEERSTEGWTDIHADELHARKVMRNGQLFIRKGDEWYDILGNKIQ